MKILKVNYFEKIPENFTGIIEYPDKEKYWYKDGKVHRDDGGPAIIFLSGTKKWFQNNKCHRIGGPAIEASDGYKIWCQNGKLHRTDGPAVIYEDGDIKYYINGMETYKEAVEVYAALFPDSP